MTIQRMPCRGEDKRRQICKNYRIIPKAHFRILSGVSIHSDAGDTMTEEYFIFNAVDKNDTTHVYNIYCGISVAKSFARLAGITLPPIYNPLRNESQSNKAKSHNATNLQNSIKWNKERKQLYDITMITLIYLGDVRTDLPLFQVKERLEKYISCEPYLSDIKRVNTIIGKVAPSFQNILDRLSKNNNLKEIQYDLILQKLIDNSIEQHLE